MPTLGEYLTVKDAAEFLGVAPSSPRNWGAAGKIPEYRHPINNSRLYRPADLKKVIRRLRRAAEKHVVDN